MRKKTMVILFILSNAFFVAALIDIVVESVLVAPIVSHCTSICASPELLRIPAILIGSIILAVCYVVFLTMGIIVLIGALVKQVKQRQWAWFACTLLFGFLPFVGDFYLLIYLIVVPESPLFIAAT